MKAESFRSDATVSVCFTIFRCCTTAGTVEVEEVRIALLFSGLWWYKYAVEMKLEFRINLFEGVTEVIAL